MTLTKRQAPWPATLLHIEARASIARDDAMQHPAPVQRLRELL
jgi:hypothetical protein